MKKSIVAVMVVFVAAVAALPIIYHYIQGQQNQVFVTETVIAGKPSAAKGITLNFKQCDVASGKLLWDINYKISKETKTTAQFHRVTDGHYDAFFNQAYVDIEDGLLHSSLEIGPLNMPKDILYDVAKRTQNNNQPHKETLLLKDYYKYYPMNLEINMEGYYINNPTPAGQSTGQYFKIPVPDTYTVDVSVTKNQSGKITDYDITSPYTYLNVPVQNIFTTSGCYLVLGTPTYGTSFDEDTQELGEEWEIQLPKEMQGIHFIPFTAKEGNPRWLSIDLEHARMAYPLSSDCRVVNLQLSEDGKNLLLLTQEKKGVYLCVIDRKSMELQQKVFLFQDRQEN